MSADKRLRSIKRLLPIKRRLLIKRLLLVNSRLLTGPRRQSGRSSFALSFARPAGVSTWQAKSAGR